MPTTDDKRLEEQAILLREVHLAGSCPAWIRTMTEGSKDHRAANPFTTTRRVSLWGRDE
jgi:hypothetical protein